MKEIKPVIMSDLKMNFPTLHLKSKLNLFLFLAFIPVLPLQYFSYATYGDMLGWLIPFYGFLLLLIKKDKLATFLEAYGLYRFVGIALIVASVFAYYAVAPFYPSAQFYGVANYTIYILGLFLVFFKISGLREALATVILIVAATASPFVGKWMEVFLQPSIPTFVQIMGVIANALGVPARIVAPDTFLVTMRNGGFQPVGVAAGCIGIYSFLTFSVIMIVTMMEDSGRLPTKLLWSVGGIVGTFLVNIIRVSLILWVIYNFGFEGWGQVHTPIGYVLFMVWLAFFFVLYSKRQVIQGGLQAMVRKLQPAK